ncbi:hypothetical protein [Clostridium massiliamazoniense]|uniref:hypothetical protein n=1 Tax=Clostridium massiliamazoniense TaxID=1347366 RepID=UPI0006D7AC09|nr:hypothetical protein [Clostridium massiliamazoniense]
MNGVELMNFVNDFLPRNSKVVNVDVEKSGFRGEEVENVIVEYIFRSGEYTMILENENGEWYIKEIFDSFGGRPCEMRTEIRDALEEEIEEATRGEKKMLKATTPINVTSNTGAVAPINVTSNMNQAPHMNTTAPFKTPVKVVPKEELIGSNKGAQEGYTGMTGDKVLECIDGNVTGRGRIEKVCVVERDSKKDGKTVKELYLTIRAINGTFKDEVKLSRFGYDPNIGLFDLTANGVQDILISMQSGESGGFYIYYAYSYIDNKLTKIFDSLQFNRDVNYNVEYLDNYAVRVSGGVMNYEYFVDIRQRDILYLNKLYDGCKLRKPTKGSVSGIVNLYPISINNNRIFQLHFISHILGVADDDQVAGLVYVIGWDNDKNKFAILEQRVVIRGDGPPDNYGLDKVNPKFTVIPSYIPKINQ